MSKAIRARCENGVLKPFEQLDLEEREEVTIVIRRDIEKVLRKYLGVLGEASFGELMELKEEAHFQ